MPCLSAYDGFAFLLAPFQRFLMRLLGTIASSSTIALQFTADGRFVYPYYVGYFCLVLIHFQKCFYLVSLFSGKLSVDRHKRSFDLAVSEPILPQLASFDRCKVAFTS